MKKQTSVLIQVVLIVVLVLLVLATVEASAIPAPTPPPPPQHVQLEDGGTVYILGDCHLVVDVNGRESLQVTCTAEK